MRSTIKRAHFGGLSMGGATALGLAQTPSRPLRSRHRRATRPCPSTPQSAQQWEERIAIAAEGRHGAAGRADGRRAGFRPTSWQKNPPYLDKVRAHDPRDAGQRLHRLRGGARRPRLPPRPSRPSTPPVLFIAGEKDGGALRRHAQAARGAEGLALRRACRRRPHLQPRPAAGVHRRDPRVPQAA